ncbi:MAG: alanine racemase [Pseudomonadota bacterium]
MGTARLTIDRPAIVANWRALDRLSARSVETGAVVKADCYGLGAGPVSEALAEAGAKRFFVAIAEEGQKVREALGPGPEIFVFSGHMAGDTALIDGADLVPLLNSPEQVGRHLDHLPGRAFGIQLDTGMNRLGLEPADWSHIRDRVLPLGPRLVMSHLASADDPKDAMNGAQLGVFRELVEGVDAPLSLAATGGTLLGEAYHFDLVRPGIGLYGGVPFEAAAPVVTLTVPVIQIRDLTQGETVGYGNSWTAARPSRIATIAAGYADGLIRAMGGRAQVFAGGVPCPVVGRVSMDLITVDITDLDAEPIDMELLGPDQGVDVLAEAAGTIGYEILTSLGARYERVIR